MGEKAYKVMNAAGVSNIIIGIVTLVFGITVGVLCIVNGSCLLKNKSKITF